jgi:nitrogen regulatory protein PII
MKLVLIAYNEALDDEVMNLLSNEGVETYTKWNKVLGKGEGSGPHLGTHVWPKHNNVLVVGVQDEVAKKIMKNIREFREEFRKEGVKAFMLPIDDGTS